MGKWICIPCGYIYDPELDDDAGDIEPAVKFEDLSEDWMCPLCGAPKEDFEKAK